VIQDVHVPGIGDVAVYPEFIFPIFDGLTHWSLFIMNRGDDHHGFA